MIYWKIYKLDGNYLVCVLTTVMYFRENIALDGWCCSSLLFRNFVEIGAPALVHSLINVSKVCHGHTIRIHIHTHAHN